MLNNVDNTFKKDTDNHSEINESGLKTAIKKLNHKGFSILNSIYTKREIRKIRKELDRYFKDSDETTFGKRKLLMDIPELKPILFNKNLKRIVHTINPDAFLSKSIYFNKPPKANWLVAWHQDFPINVTEKIDLENYSSWTKKQGVISVCPPVEIVKSIFSIRIHLDDTTNKNGALQVVAGSHHKRLSDKETKSISENSIPITCEIPVGGIQLMKPLLLHASSKTTNQKERHVVHLEFTSTELPDSIDWLERENLD